MEKGRAGSRPWKDCRCVSLILLSRASSSVGQSVPLIRVRSVVQVHPGPPLSGDVAQLGERLPCKQAVAGSSPAVSTIYLIKVFDSRIREPELR